MSVVHLHFGLFRAGNKEPNYRGWLDTGEEKSFPIRGTTANVIVSGSWKCWGPADQETEGDDSMHLLIQDDSWISLSDEAQKAALMYMFLAITEELDEDHRLLDYAFITSDDWSNVIGIVVFGTVLEHTRIILGHVR